MNDFTKEELQIIQWEINTAVNKLDMANLSSEKHFALNEKIQSMIDNYPECDHRTNRPPFYENGIEYHWCKYCDSKYRLIMMNGECIGYE